MGEKRKTSNYFQYDHNGQLDLSESIEIVDARLPRGWRIIQYKQVFVPLEQGQPQFRGDIPICYAVSRSGYARAFRYTREKALSRE